MGIYFIYPELHSNTKLFFFLFVAQIVPAFAVKSSFIDFLGIFQSMWVFVFVISLFPGTVACFHLVICVKIHLCLLVS